MLKKTFCCFKGISESAEIQIWHNGIRDWNDLKYSNSIPFKKEKLLRLLDEIKQAEIALKADLAGYFLARLNTRQKARILADYIDKTGFLDIETTGIDRKAKITTISLWLDMELKLFVRGFNLEQFLKYIPKMALIVTFNGASFDIPFIERTFRMKLGIPHLDIMPVLGQFGFKGGQKVIERCLGLDRRNILISNGKEAIKQWQKYKKTLNKNDLVDLLHYNAKDAYHLKYMAIYAYNRCVSPLTGHPKIPVPPQYSIKNILQYI